MSTLFKEEDVMEKQKTNRLAIVSLVIARFVGRAELGCIFG